MKITLSNLFLSLKVVRTCIEEVDFEGHSRSGESEDARKSSRIEVRVTG